MASTPSIVILVAALVTSFSALAAPLGSLTGTVRDPSGAVVIGAQVTIANQTSREVRTASTDDQGRFRLDGLPAGRYLIQITSPGFKSWEREVVLEDNRTIQIDARLAIPETRESVSVKPRSSVLPNSDPIYRALRDADSFETYSLTHLEFKRDVGVFHLKSGTISFLRPVQERVTTAVFIGDGDFSLIPAIPTEKDYLYKLIGKDSVAEAFSQLVICFTDSTYGEVKRQAQPAPDSARAKEVLKAFRQRTRSRTDRPRSFTEFVLRGDEIENLDAQVLADLYNPARPGFFSAHISGRKFNDLRYKVRPLGALPQLLAPEEVYLINLDPGADSDGVLYHAHLESEYQNRTASSEEDKRVIDAEHYRIETVIDGSEKLTARSEITYTALVDGERVIGFGLLPALRVTRVTLAEKDIDYIQERQKDDGVFYVVLPEPLVKGKQYKLSIDYQGDKVVEDEGGGNFAVGARTSWYPSTNSFSDRATFDLTFKVPSKYTLVGVGKLVKEWKDGSYAAAQWVSDIPLAVAGFNFGIYKKKSVTDPETKYQIDGYATTELPGYLRGADHFGSLTPSALTEKALVEAENSIRIYEKFFGEAPYGRIAITQQPEFNFGQSWPTLVYLPIVAFFDSTQRYMLMGGINTSLTEFIQEVTPHEVAHQWWGHMVGWASYHDQWLSEGFADFSASLYLQVAEAKTDKYAKFWDNARRTILERNIYGQRPNDAGPLWMGLRLRTTKNPGAYSSLVYPKGAYVLHMLRWMMWNEETGDNDFIAMMHDFVKTYLHRNASTEGFKQIVEKHMTKAMDVEGNGRMDWFFNEWVYGTEIPSYKLEYSITPDNGKFLLSGSLTQRGVSDRFKMLVPVYLDFDGNVMRLGGASLSGNSTTSFKVRLPQKPRRIILCSNRDILADEISVTQQGK
ncbi:MAG TPA: carboxypeptidase regulatory-like domain-containing protein [Blastocatellia bacterium]|nr:carboxypeptidase regulatory-like domain-containing protein [Blastocatellia bacterium]